MIDDFSGNYRFLSNFAPSPIIMDDEICYNGVEQAFQAYKTTNMNQRKLIAKMPAPQAKWHGKRLRPLRKDWEDIKMKVMLDALVLKFAPNTPLATKLLNTGSDALVEGNTWNDKYWGAVKQDGKYIGENHLGRLLMIVREDLRVVVE